MIATSLFQEGVLKQVQETDLFKQVVDYLSSATSCCRKVSCFSEEENLHDVAASVCCQGADILGGKSGASGCYYCRETCHICLKVDSDKPIEILSATVVNGKHEEKVDMLVPQSLMNLGCNATDSSSCVKRHPAGSTILTVLLLALPPETWHGIKDQKLLHELRGFVLSENLPALLQEEVTFP